jgi:hypothetical protein
MLPFNPTIYNTITQFRAKDLGQIAMLWKNILDALHEVQKLEGFYQCWLVIGKIINYK